MSYSHNQIIKSEGMR